MTIKQGYRVVDSLNLSQPNDIYNIRDAGSNSIHAHYAARSFVTCFRDVNADVGESIRSLMALAIDHIHLSDSLRDRHFILFLTTNGWRFNNVINRHRRLWESSEFLASVYERSKKVSPEVCFQNDEGVQYAALAEIPHNEAVMAADWLRMKQGGFLMLPKSEIDFSERFVGDCFNMAFDSGKSFVDWNRAISWVCGMDAVLVRCASDEREASVDLFYNPHGTSLP